VKITKKKLEKVIKEEILKVLKEKQWQPNTKPIRIGDRSISGEIFGLDASAAKPDGSEYSPAEKYMLQMVGRAFGKFIKKVDVKIESIAEFISDEIMPYIDHPKNIQPSEDDPEDIPVSDMHLSKQGSQPQ
jgi:hypothetical protein